MNNFKRPAVFAGQFYPADKKELSRLVYSYLTKDQRLKAKDQLKVLLVPHAGYQYSGKVAGAGYSRLLGRKYKNVFLLGCSHSSYFEGGAVFNEGSWFSPLGEIKIAEDIAREIISPKDKIFANLEAHLNEHSLEVQLPFLQTVLKGFKIVPILLGQANEKTLEVLAEKIADNLENGVLIVSSDLSHYPNYETASIVDKKTVDAIKTGGVDNFVSTLEELGQKWRQIDTFCCGAEAVRVGLLLVDKLGLGQGEVFSYANSGDVGGDKSQVVGYSSMGFYG